MGFKDRFKDIPPITVEETKETVETQEISFLTDVKTKLSEKISLIPVWFDYTEDEKHNLITVFLEAYLKESEIVLSDEEKNVYAAELAKSVYGFGEVDSLLSDKEISMITITENAPVTVVKNDVVSESGVNITQISGLCDKMLALAGVMTDKSVIRFSFKNLIITMILPPVSKSMIVIKKKNREATDFEYLLQHHKIDENIYSFLISLINDKKNILISGKPDSGKTSYVEAFLSAISNFTLLQESKFINAESFICGKLNCDEFENLVNIVDMLKSDYVVCDLNNGFFNIADKAIISTLRADSTIFAVSKLAANVAAMRKLTEKQSKAKIASGFDYIIQLDNDLFISSIAEFSLNKAGSLVMTEILSRNGDEYSYKFPEVEKALNETTVEPLKEKTFKSRFNS